MSQFQLQEEIATELDELNKRMSKIMDFIAGGLVKADPSDEDVILNAQLNAMAQYASILKQRVEFRVRTV